jgi:hypothetical protein
MAKKPAKKPSKAGKPAKALKSRKVVKATKPAKARKAAKPSPRKAVKKTVKKAVKKPAKKAAKAMARPKAKAVVRKPATAVKKVVKKAAPVKKAAAPARKPAPAKKAAVVKKAAPAKKVVVPPPARLQRERRVLPEAEAGAFTGESDDSRLLSSARAGHDELRAELKQHTEAGPELTAGDVDAKWQDAYALGDEAPGGDNMTPDQDRVDDIGKALGVEYADDEELMGGEEIAERDEHRWELDPESKEDDDE